MKRSPLRRRTPLHSTGRLNQTSAKRRHDLRNGYSKAVRDAYLADNPWCALRLDGCTWRATTIDHVKPRSRGGSLTDQAGWQPACAPCNQRKGSGTRETDARGLSLHSWETS